MTVAEPRPERARVATIVVVTFIMAAAVTAQLKSSIVPNSNPVAREQALVKSAQALDADNQALRSQLGTLNRQVRDLNSQLGGRSSQARSAADALKAEKDRIGLTAATGPGIVVQLGNGNDPHVQGDTKRDWEVKYVDIQDVVSLLWAAGAEAVSVNRQRVVPGSSFYVAGADLLLNGVHLTAPYTVEAMGDGSRFNGTLDNPDTLQDLKNRRDLYQLKLSWRTQRSLQLPAYDGPIVVRYASAGQ
ncbi:MAG: hypothetical protein NVSMB17_16580 [Candidatus Dormibacteria bacterium]